MLCERVGLLTCVRTDLLMYRSAAIGIRASGEADVSTWNQLLYGIYPYSLKPVRPRRRVMIRSVVMRISAAVVVPYDGRFVHLIKTRSYNKANNTH